MRAGKMKSHPFAIRDELAAAMCLKCHGRTKSISVLTRPAAVAGKANRKGDRHAELDSKQMLLRRSLPVRSTKKKPAAAAAAEAMGGSIG